MRADAIVLAGGRASRMGGVDKPNVVVGGRTMLRAALDAVGGCERVVVVGPHRAELDAKYLQTQEVPAGAGPVSAILAASKVLGSDGPEHVVVLAADLPFLDSAALDQLFTHCQDHCLDAVFAVDDAGRPQYLVGVWRRKALFDRIDGLESAENQPMRVLVPEATDTVPITGTADCDTAADVARANQAVALDLASAREVLRTNITALPPRPRSLSDAIGAALAEPVVAADAMPRFDVSAMDGYAVAGEGPWTVRADVGYAGGARPQGMEPGEAVRIATGAHIPEGASAVLRDEFVKRDGDTLRRLPDAPDRDDIRRRGSELELGAQVAQPNTRVDAALVSTAASVEVTTATVRGPVHAHVVLTGDEIRRDGPLRPGQTRDSLGPVLPDFLRQCGIRTETTAHLRDTPHGFDDVLTGPQGSELLVIVGATGGGAADQLRAALSRCGARLLVQRLRCRPGGSTVVAELTDGRIVLGLPGNPFAAVAVLCALAPAIVEGLTRRAPEPALTGALRNAGDVAAQVSRFAPATLREDGTWIAAADVRTAHLGSMIGARALAVVNPGAKDGDRVELLPLP
ncbi:molybdenum cofactor biosynthesis protein [Skermania sp. ID1734]|uniref:NTP transferase domain-containing protein n=1 Tax=Skermania sp. ID1734 TaxID=2597516 RepID=UPI00118082CC|nr:NTP transferase domain-containing protein [Skermania sp. ID1734]TSD97298.1 molybdenum cofactor biosynthesis protein [Skermania sp. ID1734]